ncbi:hypothetical protein B0J18DRAFT_427841 [Chaetomium sp. MPI-SDFR-AT-0129]|nr:hypothetical protein B0J18DRAFT_427841 [Chaetomium sp. MPI-SDFR-AT-0129]
MKRSREPEEDSQGVVAPADQDSEAAFAGSNDGPKRDVGGDVNGVAPPVAKIAGLDLSDESTSGSNIKMHCLLPPHREQLVFSSYEEYETHYRDQHTNRCAECRKNFPSAHLLGLHIEEWHDSFVQVKRERGERTYSCFVETCERKCSTPQKRKMHLIDKHMYPKNFFFSITRDGIDGRRSLLLESRPSQRKSSSSVELRPKLQPPPTQPPGPIDKAVTAKTDQLATEPSSEDSPVQRPDHDMDDLSSAMSSLKFVPMSVRFGRGKAAGFAKR